MSETGSPGAICALWWHQVLGGDSGPARTTRARLRRCTAAPEALTIDAVHDLNSRLREKGFRPDADRLALVAIVLAHVAETGELRLATEFGRRAGKDRPRALSEQRFQALIRTTRHADLIAPLRRAMAIVRRARIAVAPMATDLYFWSENTRTQWCFQYFGAADAAPERISQES